MDLRKDPALKAAVFFSVLALGFSLLYWLLIVLAGHGSLPFAMGPLDFSLEHNSVPGLLLSALLREFGPFVAALITLAWFEGGAGVRDLWRRLTRFRLPGRLYALAFFAPLAVSAAIVAFGVTLGKLQFAPEQLHPLRFVIFFFLMLVFDGPLGEEPGWRGLLLPKLLSRMGPAKASFAVGCVWYLWHMPLYLADGKDVHYLSYFVNVVAIAYVFTWFYVRSGGSVWMTVFLHTTTNYALFLIIKCFRYDAAGIAEMQYIYDAVLVVFAVAAALDFRRRGMPPSDPRIA